MFLGTNSILTRTSLLGRFLGCFGLLFRYFGLFFKQPVANGKKKLKMTLTYLRINSQKFSKYLKNSQKFSKILKSSQNSQKFSKILKNSQKFSKILKNSQKFSKILKNSQKFSKILKNSQKFSKFSKILKNSQKKFSNIRP